MYSLGSSNFAGKKNFKIIQFIILVWNKTSFIIFFCLIAWGYTSLLRNKLYNVTCSIVAFQSSHTPCSVPNFKQCFSGYHVCVQFSPVWLFCDLWTVVHQAPLCMAFSRQEYWRGLPFPAPGDLPTLYLLHWQVDSLVLVPPEKPFSEYNPQVICHC